MGWPRWLCWPKQPALVGNGSPGKGARALLHVEGCGCGCGVALGKLRVPRQLAAGGNGSAWCWGVLTGGGGGLVVCGVAETGRGARAKAAGTARGWLTTKVSDGSRSPRACRGGDEVRFGSCELGWLGRLPKIAAPDHDHSHPPRPASARSVRAVTPGPRPLHPTAGVGSKPQLRLPVR